MSITIRNEETCRLIRELAALFGVSLERAVFIAVSRELEILKAGKNSAAGTDGGAAEGAGS